MSCDQRCGNCQLYEVLRPLSNEDQKGLLDILKQQDVESLDENQHFSYQTTLYQALVPNISLGRRKAECEPERSAVDSTKFCDHPEKFTPVAGCE